MLIYMGVAGGGVPSRESHLSLTRLSSPARSASSGFSSSFFDASTRKSRSSQKQTERGWLSSRSLLIRFRAYGIPGMPFLPARKICAVGRKHRGRVHSAFMVDSVCGESIACGGDV